MDEFLGEEDSSSVNSNISTAGQKEVFLNESTYEFLAEDKNSGMSSLMQ